MTLIRERGAGDEPALVALWVEAWTEAMPTIDFAARQDWLVERLIALEQNGATVLVACVGDPIGFVTVDREGLVDQLAVSRSRQSQGVARALLDAALARHPSGLSLTVNSDNARAVRFYTRYGFVVSGQGVNARSGLPVMVMQFQPGKRLPGAPGPNLSFAPKP